MMLAKAQQLADIAGSLTQVDDWDDVSDNDILEALRTLESAARLISAASVAVTAQADRRGLSTARAYSSVGALLRRSLNIAPGEAKLRERLASALCGTVQPSGDLTPPRLPSTADALADGAISLAHARVVHQTITDLPRTIEPSVVDNAESFLAAQARVLDPVDLRRVAKRLQATLDQDGLLRDERDAVADRELCISRDHRGRYVFLGRLDAEAGAAFQTAIHALSAPEPAANGQPDPRTAARRHADALVALVDRALAAGDLPTDGGERPQVTVTIGYDALAGAIGSATIGHRDVLTASAARRIACDARIIPMVLGSRSEPLDVGRAGYVVPQAMRRALVARDEGCAFPGCDQPPGWAHAHHVQHWANGGETKLDNLVLLCGHHRVSRMRLRGSDVEARVA